jgi:hypothetical protein
LAAKKSTAKTAEPAKKTTTVRRRRPKVTHEMIEERAYLIATSGTGGSQLDHWLTAERELVGA